MEFLAALKKVYETRNSDDELNEPFLIYSRAADLIGNSYEDKKKLSLFFAVSKRLNLLMLLSSVPFDSTNVIRGQYSSVADLLSGSAFNRLIDVLIDVIGIVPPDMDEEIYEPYDNGFDDYSNSGAIVYNGTAEKTTTSAETNCNASSENPKTTEANRSEFSDFHGTTNGLTVIHGLVLLFNVAILVICGVSDVRWNVYQWIVGVTGSVILLAGGFWLSAIMENVLIDDEIFDTVALCAAVVADFILFFILKDSYNVVCYWVSAALLILGCCAVVKTFGYDSFACGWFDIGACVVTAAIIILNIFL
ncbi:MAG TPA: hypothetical protein DHU65_00180 [Clostridiales bacterium]|nr:hypothetical protein [Clostridiales bacterium]